jgi:hypothetical protein
MSPYNLADRFIIIEVKGLLILIGWLPAWQRLLLAHSWERIEEKIKQPPPCTIEVSYRQIWQVFLTLPR